MLVLSRRVGEQIRIGDEVCFKVLGIKGSQVQIGFEAPAHIEIHRDEIYQKIQNEKRTSKFNRRHSRLHGNTRVYHSNKAWVVH